MKIICNMNRRKRLAFYDRYNPIFCIDYGLPVRIKLIPVFKYRRTVFDENTDLKKLTVAVYTDSVIFCILYFSSCSRTSPVSLSHKNSE